MGPTVDELNLFDVNCQIGKVNRPFPPMFHGVEDLLLEMDYLGVREALVCTAPQYDQNFFLGNRTILDLCRSTDRLHPVWVLPVQVDIWVSDVDAYVTDMVARGVRAVRLFPGGPGTSDWIAGALWRALEAHRVPLLLSGTSLDALAGGTTWFSFEELHSLCQRYPQLPVVTMRTMGHLTNAVTALLRSCPNLHIDISLFGVHRGIQFLYERFGARQMLFGTGLPWQPGNAGIAMLRAAKIPDPDKRLIAGDNLRRLLKEVS